MDFNIEEHENRKEVIKKRKNNKKLVFAFTIFMILSIILIGVYFYLARNQNEAKEVEKKTQPVVKKKITIVDEDSNERPIAVMIDNNIGNEKHAGLQDSYLNYEIIVEGGLTRIMAIFKDKDVSLIGPIRSSRHYFLDYALESDAIYTHYGWSPYAEKDIKNLGVNNINGLTDETPFWRDTKIRAPHNVFTSIKNIQSYATAKNYSIKSNDWQLFKYSADEINLNPAETKSKNTNNEESQQNTEEVETANQISMTYSNHQARSYSYDSENKYYLRSMNGIAHLDKTTNLQLHYKNIIIEKVENYSLDSYGRQDLKTVSSGEGYFITNGYAKPITWEKDSRSSKTEYKYKNGKGIVLNDGNTFIQIVPITSNITIE